jgi:hypothetical protein
MPVDAARDERRARNEALFREVNERIEELSSDESEQEASLEVVCECGRNDCTELLEVTRAQYEAVRSDPPTLPRPPRARAHRYSTRRRAKQRLFRDR